MSHEGQRPCPQGGACDGLAFSDIRKVLTWDEHGNVLVKASHEIDDDAAYVISEIVQTIAPGHITLKTKLADKKGALDSLARYFKLFVDKVDVNAKMHHISEPLQVLFAPWEQEEEAERASLPPWTPPGLEALEMRQSENGEWDLDDEDEGED